MWPLNECVFYVQIQADKPVYSDSSLDKLRWSCSAWPIESLETSYGSLDLYMKYTFSCEATSPLKKKCGHLDLFFRRIAKVGRKIGVKVATISYGFVSPNKKKKLLLSPTFRFASKADQGVHTFSLNCRQFSNMYKN